MPSGVIAALCVIAVSAATRGGTEPLVRGWQPFTIGLEDGGSGATGDEPGSTGFADTDAADYAPARPGEPLWLTVGNVFRPLTAATHETRSFASWQRFHSDRGTEDFGTVGFGGEFPVVRWAEEGGVQWQLSLGAVAISMFNLDGDAQELINTDFVVGVPLTFRRDDWSGRVRVYHMSSHVGEDPWLLALDPGIVIERQSTESLEFLLARDIAGGLRVYGGGERILHSLTHRDRWSVRVGTDLKHRAGEHHRWVAGVDLNLREQTGWRGDLSVKAGVQWKARADWGRNVGLLAEYYRGMVPYGQFWDFTLEYFGLGLTFRF